jgi:RNA recognition motif-containing protein
VFLGDDYTGRPTSASTGADGVTGKNGVDGSKTHSKTAQKILRVQKQPPAPTLFIGNLGFETTEDAIRELFEAHKEKKKKPKEEPDDDAKPKEKTKDAWIRKIRMGTFEDSGLCKGYILNCFVQTLVLTRTECYSFAFADFTTIEQATSVLINPKNHLLNGRKLVVEYAGADAVRRGAPKAKREEGVPLKGRESKSHGPRADRLKHKQHQDMSEGKSEQSVAQSVSVVEAQPHPKQHHTEGDERRQPIGMEKKIKGPRVRPKPGAALALAKRETAAILPSQGKKITF